ncbi:glycoside hydrolase family 72 protein, partial [Melanomma pulvis-pyrius CBS 109.77]
MRLVGCLLFFCSAVLAIPTISVKGSKFFTSDGDQFYIKGVAYTASANNANNIVNGSQCELDAPRIKELGANTIRVYSVDPTLDHDKCMDAFANAGIYVLVDMATPVFFINRITPEWTKELRNAFAQVIDGFQKYDNLLGFFAGNEIINDPKSTGAAAYAKAVIADMKAYRDLMQYRKIPIGYSAADLDDLRLQQQDYFNCGSDDISADFFGTNRYSWCGASSFTKSGYDTMYSQVDGYSIPYFLSETGCLGSGDFRIFDDQIALLGRQMNDRLSGNIIYQWGEQPNGYGLVSYANTESGTGAVKTKQDFSNLKSQWATLEPAGVKASDYDPTLTRRDCPEFTSGVWNIRANDQLPTLG